MGRTELVGVGMAGRPSLNLPPSKVLPPGRDQNHGQQRAEPQSAVTLTTSVLQSISSAVQRQSQKIWCESMFMVPFVVGPSVCVTYGQLTMPGETESSVVQVAAARSPRRIQPSAQRQLGRG